MDLRQYYPYLRSAFRRIHIQTHTISAHVRKRFFRYLLIALAIGAIIFVYPTITSYFASPPAEGIEAIKHQVPKGLDFVQNVPPLQIENLTMIGEVYHSGITGDSKRGMILRALRFQNITRAVERRYDLPDNLLLAMIMQESMGVDLLPNSTDDGGIGLCHMQPSTASEFGLRTLDNCTDLRNFEHGRKLRSLIRQHKFNRRELIQYDDRFHPILNIDAAGRMIWYYYKGKQLKSTPLRTAIYRYAGYNNYKHYYKMVDYYMKLLADSSVIDDVRRTFNALNPTLRINGQPADFDKYIAEHQQQHSNYGLDKYAQKPQEIQH